MSFAITPYQQPYKHDDIISPFIQSFDQSATKLKAQFSLSQSLDVMFPEQKRQDRELSKARETLGELASQFSDAEIREIITDMDFLVTQLLDVFKWTHFYC